jgi:hypothetical protein
VTPASVIHAIAALIAADSNLDKVPSYRWGLYSLRMEQALAVKLHKAAT